VSILILSEDKDLSTNDLIKWLKYFNADYSRINASVTAESMISLQLWKD